jgi:hypothetical protein
MTTIGIWKRRDANNNYEWFYGIGDFIRTYATEDEVRAAFAVLVEETNKYPSRDPHRAYRRLQDAKHPLFVK